MPNDARVAVVTGGGRGIGRGIVLALADLGFAVVVNYRSDLESAESACREAEARGAPKAGLFRADVADLAEGRRLLESTIERHGRIDLWVNNAGVAPEHRLDMLETTPESWDRVLATNLKGPFFLSQAVARRMIELLAAGIVAEPQIVFITSISSRFASVNRPEYCVSKAGLSMVAQLFAIRQAVSVVRSVAAGLKYAAGECDPIAISSPPISCGHAGHVKIIDLGLAAGRIQRQARCEEDDGRDGGLHGASRRGIVAR